METRDVAKKIESFCPLDLAEEWDNSGFQIDMENEVKKILVALELTDSVAQEAIDNDVDMVITHHPLFFSNLKALKVAEPVTARAISVVQNGITVYSSHTNFDSVSGGNNDYFGNMIGLSEFYTINDNNQMCRGAFLKEAMRVDEIASLISIRLDIDKSAIRIVGSKDNFTTNVAWCTGAGADFIDEVAHSGAQLFITGDIKYHAARRAEELGLDLIDIGHYGSEKIFVDNMYEKLKMIIDDDVEVIKSIDCMDPFSYI